MGRADHLILGDYNVVCFQCGFKRKAGDMEKNWQGYYVCPEHNEPRQTQDFVRAIPDNQNVPWSQPDPGVVYTYVDTYIGTTDGINKIFQLGSGLYPTTVTNVKVDTGTSIPFTSNGFGKITTTGLPIRTGLRITASGREVVG